LPRTVALGLLVVSASLFGLLFWAGVQLKTQAMSSAWLTPLLTTTLIGAIAALVALVRGAK
jgi:hypothetical protein